METSRPPISESGDIVSPNPQDWHLWLMLLIIEVL